MHTHHLSLLVYWPELAGLQRRLQGFPDEINYLPRWRAEPVDDEKDHEGFNLLAGQANPFLFASAIRIRSRITKTKGSQIHYQPSTSKLCQPTFPDPRRITILAYMYLLPPHRPWHQNSPLTPKALGRINVSIPSNRGPLGID